jgi:hypothetical protein
MIPGRSGGTAMFSNRPHARTFANASELVITAMAVVAISEPSTKHVL